ncbi:MAG: TonB-dependent receptor [Bacteroidota bacterium]
MDKTFIQLIKSNIWGALVILLMMSPIVSFAQTVTVTGTVKDIKGEAIPGAAVKVKDATIAVQTDADGKFSIKVPDQKSVLQFSYLGFISSEEIVGTRKVLNIILKESIGSLDEVVIQGYGASAKKSDLTGSTSSVNATQIAERQPANIYDAIQGQAAGVLVINDNGEPGAEGSIQIRGASTFSSTGGNNPLYVVDGIISDGISNINPNDIQNIEILKDAGSTSIYGARASNGVILVTTKKGQEGKPRFDISYGRKTGTMSHTIQQANSEDLRLWRQIQKNNDPNAGSNTDSLNIAYNADNYLEKMLLGNIGVLNDLKVGISGGQKGLTYYSSLNYFDDKGSVLNTWAKRMQGRINVDFQVTPKFKYTTSINFYWNKKSTWSTGGSLNPVFDRPNNLRIYLPDGALTSYTSSKRNPIANALLETNITEGYRASFANNIEYKILKDLRFTATASAQLDDSDNNYFQPQFLDDNGNENRGRQSASKKFNWSLQSFFNYDKTIGKNHKFNATLGVSAEKDISNALRFGSLPGSFVSEDITNYYAGNIDINQTRTEGGGSSLASLIGRIGYNYKGRYIVSSTFRRDGSSKFGPQSKWGNFISGSMAWRFSDEKFMSWAKGKVLDDAKLRISVGAQGNDGIGGNEDATLISFGDVSYMGNTGAVISNRLGNPLIQWENTIQANYGTDISMLKGRLLLVVDYYRKATNKLLADNLLPKETGFQNVRVNAGDLLTTGAEFAISGTPISTPKFSWYVNANISFQKGKVKSLINNEPFITGTRYLISPGGKLGDFYGYKQLGIYRWTASNAYSDGWSRLEPVNVSADGQTAEYYTLNGQRYSGNIQKLSGPAGFLKGGDAIFDNYTKDGIIDDADRQVIGNAIPDYFLGFINTFTYKRLSLNVIFNATIGGQIYNAFKESFSTFGSSNGTAFPEAIYGAWRKEGDIAIYPYFPTKDNNGNQKRGVNSYYLEDASFLRLSSARLNYSLPPALANKILLKGLSMFVYGTNLLTWTNYTGFDPEFSIDNPLTPGTDGGRYPKRRDFGFGININL